MSEATRVVIKAHDFAQVVDSRCLGTRGSREVNLCKCLAHELESMLAVEPACGIKDADDLATVVDICRNRVSGTRIVNLAEGCPPQQESMVGKVERYEVGTETADNNAMIVYSVRLAVYHFREINGSKCQADRAGGCGGRSRSGFLAASQSSEGA